MISVKVKEGATITSSTINVCIFSAKARRAVSDDKTHTYRILKLVSLHTPRKDRKIEVMKKISNIL